MKRFVAASAVVVLSLILVACETVKIGSLVNDPARWVNKTVRIAGTVENSMGAVGHGAYQVSDGTGSIWVISASGVPARGAKVAVEGTVFQGVQIFGQSFGVAIKERQHRSR